MPFPNMQDVMEALEDFEPRAGDTGRFSQLEVSVRCERRRDLFKAIRALPEDALGYADFEGGDSRGFTLRISVEGDDE